MNAQDLFTHSAVRLNQEAHRRQKQLTFNKPDNKVDLLMNICLWQQAQIEQLTRMVQHLYPPQDLGLHWPNCGEEPEDDEETSL